MDPNDSRNPALSRVVISLLKGVVFADADLALWQDLLTLQARVRDYVAVLGLDVVLDEAEGHAFLRSRTPGEQSDGEVALPRLVARRQLSFPVSLLLALLRKRLAESDAGGGDNRLILSRDEVVDLLRLYLPAGPNEARIVDNVTAHLNKIEEFGFVRRMAGPEPLFEVRRLLKSFVDAQWLFEFDARLAGYRAHLSGGTPEEVSP